MMKAMPYIDLMRQPAKEGRRSARQRAGASGRGCLESAILHSPRTLTALPPPVENRPSLRVAVQIDRQRQPNRWEDWRFDIAQVLLDEGQFGTQPRLLRDDGRTASFLHPGFEVSLHRDEAEGYYLNLSSGAPVWFVMWRLGELVDEGNPPVATPERVTVSYNEAGRLLDAQERVDNRPLPPEVCAWLQAYADEHYRPEVKQRRRPASFRAPQDR
jgi:hypothetical protein